MAATDLKSRSSLEDANIEAYISEVATGISEAYTAFLAPKSGEPTNFYEYFYLEDGGEARRRVHDAFLRVAGLPDYSPLPDDMPNAELVFAVEGLAVVRSTLGFRNNKPIDVLYEGIVS